MKGMKILVPTDFSKNADAALRYAIGLAADTHSRLIILHSYRLLQTTVPTVDQSPFSIKNQWDKDTWEKFRKLEKTVIKGAKIKYDFEVDVGFASDAIISSAESNEIDLLVMGSAGAGKMSSLLGSTTLKMIEKVKWPFMVIPMNAEYSGLDNIVFAYDNKMIKHPANLNILVDYIKTFNSKLEILYVCPENEVIEENLLLLGKQFEGIDHAFTSVKSDSIAEGILSHLKGTSTNVLVAFKRDHTLLEKVFNYSVTKKLILHSELPLLVLHES